MDNIDMKMKGIIKCTFTASCPAATVLHRKATDQVCSANDASSEAAWVKVAPIPRKGNVYGAMTSVINSTGTKIRDMGLPCKTGGTYNHVGLVALTFRLKTSRKSFVCLMKAWLS